MNQLDWNFIIDLVVVLYGLYALHGAVQMKTTGKIGPMIASLDEIRRCKNTSALVAKIVDKMFLFSIAAIVYGVFSIVDDTYLHLPFAVKAGTLCVFIVVCIWFIRILKNARKEFIK